MLLKFTTKSKETVNLNINLDDLKEIVSKEGNYIRFMYKDNTEVNLTYNSKSFDFNTDHELTVDEINKLILEINLIP